MNSFPTVSKSIFTNVIRANPDWETRAIEGYTVAAMQYVDSDGTVRASALYEKGKPPEYRIFGPISTDWQSK